ncbi:gas vesicle protein K [Roseobacter sp. CCS2]|uniref:gas vesicle protein K n=1 Tax=Roseobacter sp. CCS2 TaxID=391593 RepID=UPI0000F3C3E2|nr:gas vesicle protein K [Roseobacter sp. CCS2]EBA11528.1 putative gas vesicle synthesis protein [Roseobacter sp. CCS2]
MNQSRTQDTAQAQDIMDRLSGATDRIAIDPDTIEQDLARVVLGLMEFLRQLMELQAIRRMDTGTLSGDQEEKLGTTLMKAEAAIHDLAAKFGLKPADLALDLGPLGKTI